MEGDHSRTNLAYSAECRGRVAEILVDDVGFQTKIRKAQELILWRTSSLGAVSQSASRKQ